jgi:hypothetical protein
MELIDLTLQITSGEIELPRITEDQVAYAVLQILASRPNGRATVKMLRDSLPNYLTLSAEDRTDSDTRTNEEIWEQQVRNLKSHKKTEGNVFQRGFIVSVGRGVWQITEAGKLRIAAAA